MLNYLTQLLQNKYLEPNKEAHAAVAILLTETNHTSKVLLVKRATRETDPWSGHMAFPGGRRGPLDKNLLGTALRETMEETGIDLAKCVIIGNIESVYSTVRPDICIQPFIFTCTELPEITLNEELRAYYWIPLEELDRSRGITRIVHREHPAFLVEGEAVWGLTYRMLEKLLSILNKEEASTYQELC